MSADEASEREQPLRASSPIVDFERQLRVSLEALSQLETGQVDLEQVLTKVGELAVTAVPGAEGAGVHLLDADNGNTLVATSDFVSLVDGIQYGLGQGPCISATSEGRLLQSDSLGADQRWPKFGAQVARLNVHSALSIPLITGGGVIGSMNIYARRKYAFGSESAEYGQLFAGPAAIAVQNAQVLAQSKRLAAQLQAAMSSRAVIDQAIGIMMSRSGCSADEAFARLRVLSQAQHEKLNVVARSLVDQAVRKARARRHAGD